jgi:hypothetical protein
MRGNICAASPIAPNRENSRRLILTHHLDTSYPNPPRLPCRYLREPVAVAVAVAVAFAVAFAFAPLLFSCHPSPQAEDLLFVLISNFHRKI